MPSNRASDQGGLFPAYLEDFVDEDNPVRAADAFVETLGLRALAFGHGATIAYA